LLWQNELHGSVSEDTLLFYKGELFNAAAFALYAEKK
jgi:hypothetical protein